MKALICGISGQDGSYLAKLLLSKGYEVSGTSRDAHMSRFHNLEMLGIKEDIRLHSMAVNDFRSVLQTISDVAPDEIYYLAGQSWCTTVPGARDPPWRCSTSSDP